MGKGLRGFVDDALARTGPLAVEKSGDFPTARPFAHKLHRALFGSDKIPEGQNQPHHRSADRNWQGSTYRRAFAVQTSGATSVGLLYQDLIRRGEVLADGRLPPILPIVLYNGSQRWSAVTDVCELIPPVPGLVEQFKPRMKHLLIDENAYSEQELASLRNLVAAVFRIEHPASPQAIGGLLSLLSEWLADRPDLRRMFALWIRATLMRRAEYRIVLPRVDDLQELNVMLAERLEEWAHAYKAEGKAEGEALALQKLLRRRFGSIPAEVLQEISGASVEQIDIWLDQVLDAGTLEDLFGPSRP
ncbi:MAG: DUF4351 domain-containing protein [Accumulibacter sp.]|jgi:hypothetical protein|uniref:DUF4351 domain-containing protein n=1 Tax=Accumulibacter sp. TaxID=2053492 RepID=UPI002FC34F8C